MINARKYLPFIAFVFCGLWVACTQTRDPCLTPKIASLNIEMMHLPLPLVIGDTTFVDTALPAAVFRPLSVTVDNPYTIYPQQADFTISLSPDSNICQWVFATDTPAYSFDTLTFHYQRNLQFISNACGFTYFYTLDTVLTTHVYIDSLHITNTSVTNNVNTKHLQIFIHPGH